MTFDQISVELYKTGVTPFDIEISVSNTVRRIIKKCDYHKLDWNLVKTRKNNKLHIKKEKK